MQPRLPLPDGDRVVRLQTADPQAGRRRGVEPADFARWRAQLPLLHMAALLGGYMALMMAVCLLACVVPMRRAPGVQPTEALAAYAQKHGRGSRPAGDAARSGSHLVWLSNARPGIAALDAVLGSRPSSALHRCSSCRTAAHHL